MENLPKVIFLAIYNETPEYNKMYDTHMLYLKYLQSQMKLMYYFVMFTNLEDQEYIVDDTNHMLYIHGEESYIPGILNKTIKAFDIVHNKLGVSYDFIFRTNISTFIHFHNTFLYLKEFVSNPTNQRLYIGPMHTLSWIDTVSGIHDHRYSGLRYCSGVCIILNSIMVEDLVCNKEKLVYTLIDDVAIGHYISKIANVRLIDILPYRFSFDPHNMILNTNHLCYMNNFNKSDREIDVTNLSKISYWYTSNRWLYKNVHVPIKIHDKSPKNSTSNIEMTTVMYRR